MDGPHRHDEAQPVRRSHVTTAPPPRQVDAVLGRDEPDVRYGQGFGTQVVLPHSAQPGSPERRHVGPHQRFEARVARLGQQDGAHACRQVLRTSIGFASVRERAGKPSSGIDLQQQLRQIDMRQARRDWRQPPTAPRSGRRGRRREIAPCRAVGRSRDACGPIGGDRSSPGRRHRDGNSGQAVPASGRR